MEIINGDALRLIDNMQSNVFDLIILDPNYQDWQKIIQSGFISKCVNSLRNDGNLILFTKQPFDYELRAAINDIFRREIIWSFDNGGAWVSKKMPLVSFQKIYWCIKSKDFYFNPRTGNDYQENTRNFKRTCKIWEGYKAEGRQFQKSEEGTWIRDHIHYNKPLTGEIPSKPEELIQIIVRCFCRPGGKIFNPFAGSGTVERIAIHEKRDIVSIEIDEKRWYAIIDDLLSETKRQEQSIYGNQ